VNARSLEMNIKGAHIRNKNQKESETQKDPVLVLFENWQSVRNHPEAKLDRKRSSFLKGRLSEGHLLDDLLLVPSGVQFSAFHRGDNPTRTVYDKIETIYRDAG
jgi:hypothetical protein